MKAGAFCILKTSHHKAHRVFSNPRVFVATSEMLQALIYALCSDTSTSHWLWSSKVRSSLVCCFKGSRSTRHQLLSLGWVIVLTLFLWREKNNERTVVLFFFFSLDGEELSLGNASVVRPLTSRADYRSVHRGFFGWE